VAFGYVLSLLIHLFALCLIAFGFSWNKKAMVLNPESISIQIVDISDKTRLKRQNKVKKPEKGKSKIFKSSIKKNVQKKKNLEEKTKSKVIKKEKKQIKTPVKQTKKISKEKKVENIFQGKIVPKRRPILKKENKQKKQKIEEKIKSKQKPIFDQKNKKVQKKVKDDFDNVLKAVSDMREKDLDLEKDKKAKKVILNKANEEAEHLTISDIDALRQQLSKCWTPPSGVKNAEEIVVEIDLSLGPDAYIESAKIVDKERMLRDHTYKIAAEAALRALKHPACTPLRLPKEKYSLWKNFRLVFNPQKMFR